MKDELERRVAEACKGLFGDDVDVELTRPEEQFGDFSTNVALQLAPKLGRKPRDIADELADKLREALAPEVDEVSIAGPGFINLRLSDASLLESLKPGPARAYDGQEILVEFGDPNPFKAMHIGHLYSYVVGDAICNLLEAAGAQVRRLSYHGDVGLHVAKAIWAMQGSGYDDKKISDTIRNNVGLFYAKGAKAYEEDEKARAEIDDINRRVYASDPAIRTLYDEGKQHSLASFRSTLADLGISNDRQYMESESAQAGLDIVRKNIGKVFKESDGAIVYEGEKVGLHTRVFITGKGLPTYEAKDLGLTELKAKDYPDAALSIVITAHEQSEYFKVMLAALAEVDPATAKKTKHLSHGFVSLSSGKMSSRTGDVY
ncbi:MAG: arginine--tRNA ligase, partial [Candidatus Saccharimonadales bacterium]